jgi:hypothetical protein
LEEDGPQTRSEISSKIMKVHSVGQSRIDQGLDDYRIGRLSDGRIGLVALGAVRPEEEEPKCPEYLTEINSVIGLARIVSHDIFRGSGFGVSKWLSWRLGLKYTPAAITFRGANNLDHDLTVTRRGGSTYLGSIRGVVKQLGCAEGCEVILLFELSRQCWQIRHTCEDDACPALKRVAQMPL